MTDRIFAIVSLHSPPLWAFANGSAAVAACLSRSRSCYERAIAEHEHDYRCLSRLHRFSWWISRRVARWGHAQHAAIQKAIDNAAKPRRRRVVISPLPFLMSRSS